MKIDKLNSREVRSLFGKKAQDMLGSDGFFFKQGCFYRIHPEMFILSVGLEFYKGGGFDLLIWSTLFCSGEKTVLNPGGRRITELARRDGIFIDNFCIASTEKLLEDELNCFYDLIYGQLVSIRTYEQDYQFRGFLGRSRTAWGGYPLALECLQFGAYDHAIGHLLEDIKQQEEYLRWNEERQNDLTAAYEKASKDETRQQILAYREKFREEANKSLSRLHHLEKRYEQFLRNDYSGANEDFSNACKITDDTCKREFGSRYKKALLPF